MTRYGCFELKTSCWRCGNPVPVNGPVRSLPCPSCFEEVTIPVDTLAGFVNDFEDEYDELAERQGSGGTLFGGGGTWEYGVWRLPPRCSECERVLPEVEVGTDGTVACPKCDATYPTFPAPDWLVEACPSVVQVIGGQREGGSTTAEVDDVAPIAMACPRCGAGLLITPAEERVFPCGYCQTEVFVPDAIWIRMHPVAKVAEWFLRYEGRSRKERITEQREVDEHEEKVALRGWRPPPRRRTAPEWLVPAIVYLMAFGLVAVIVLVGTASTLALAGSDVEAIAESLASVLGGLAIGGFVIGMLLVAFSTNLSFAFGRLGRCKAALAALAEEHGWDFDGAEHRQSMGCLSGELEGVPFEVHPDSEYAVEVELDESAFYLKTEPPAWPSDDLVRFTTGDPDFDRLFPFRYASPEVAERISASADPIRPFLWFRERWGDRLARLVVDGSDLELHLAPGGLGSSERTKYLLPDEIEPLIHDAVTLARAIVAVSSGGEAEVQEA